MWRNRFPFAAAALALAAVAWAQTAVAADLFEPPPEKPQAYLPPPPPIPPPALIVQPPPVVIYGYLRPFPYRPYGCGNCGMTYGYPYYIPSANHPASYYRPYYNHHLGLETNCAPYGGMNGWGGYGYK